MHFNFYISGTALKCYECNSNDNPNCAYFPYKYKAEVSVTSYQILYENR